MGLRKWFFDVTPAGTALTTANIKADDLTAATSTGVPAGTGTLVSTATAHTNQAAEFTANSASTVQTRLGFTASTTSGALSYYQRAAGAPAITGSSTAQLLLSRVRCTSGGIDVLLRSNGTVVLAHGSTVTTSSTGLWTAGTWHRLSLTFNITAGTAELKVYAGDSLSALATLSVTGGTATGTTTAIDVGVLTNGLSSTWVTQFDSVQMEDASSSELGPYIPAANVAPVPSAGTDQNVNTGATVTLTGSATDSDGTVASTSWTQIDGPAVSLSGTGLTRTFTPTVAGIYTFRFSATDDDGSTATDDMVVNVRGVNAVPNALTSNAGGWTNQGGAASLVAAVGDSNDSTFAETADNPSGDAHVYTLAPLQAGTVTVTTRDRATVASPVVTRLVEILDVSNAVLGDSEFALTTTWANHTTVTDDPVAAGAVVRVRVTDTQAA